jgi:STE24 endopeptidase
MLGFLGKFVEGCLVNMRSFGFNKTTVGTLVSDTIKGFMLALVIGAPLLYGILYLMNAMGEYWWLSVWLLLTGFSLLTITKLNMGIVKLNNTKAA